MDVGKSWKNPPASRKQSQDGDLELKCASGENSDACNFRGFRPTVSPVIFQLLTSSELAAGGVYTSLSTGAVEVCVRVVQSNVSYIQRVIWTC